MGELQILALKFPTKFHGQNLTQNLVGITKNIRKTYLKLGTSWNLFNDFNFTHISSLQKLAKKISWIPSLKHQLFCSDWASQQIQDCFPTLDRERFSRGKLSQIPCLCWQKIPSREWIHIPPWEVRKIIFKMPFLGDMLVFLEGMYVIKQDSTTMITIWWTITRMYDVHNLTNTLSWSWYVYIYIYSPDP